MEVLGRGILLGCVLAAAGILLALMEIAIEGPLGWALGLPTWRKRVRIISGFLGGRELTGYHAPLFLLLVILFHLPFFWIGHPDVKWSVGLECGLLTALIFLAVFWDFVWFMLNPAFTLARFRRGEIWWHRHWVGRVPADYLLALVLVFFLTSGAHLATRTSGVWLGNLGEMASLALILLGLDLAAPMFHRFLERASWRHRLSQGWQHFLSDEELAELRRRLTQLTDARFVIAELARQRAEREQLGLVAPVSSDQDHQPEKRKKN